MTDDKAALQYAGKLSHVYAVTCEDRDGGRYVVSECDDPTTARRVAGERKNGRAWRRIERDGVLRLDGRIYGYKYVEITDGE